MDGVERRRAPAPIRRFALRVPLAPDEPSYGLMARLAWRHGRLDVRGFASSCGLPLRSLLAGGGVSNLASAALVDDEVLRFSTPAHDIRRRIVKLRGETLRTIDHSVATRRWCPACLSEDLDLSSSGAAMARHRFWWDVAAIETCPRHGCRIEDACARCGAGANWDHAPLHACRCGAKLNGDGRPQPVGAFSRYLHDRLLGLPRHASPNVDDLAVAELIPLARLLGLVECADWHARWPDAGTEADGDLRDAGMACLEGWPFSFRAVLNRKAVRERGGKPSGGVLATYGWVYEQFVSTYPDGPVGDRLRSELRRHAVANGVMADGEAMLGKKVARGVTLVAASRSIGSDVARTRSLLVAAGRMPRGSRRGVSSTVDPAAVAALASDRRRRIGVATAAQRLGIGRPQVRSLVSSGVLDGCLLGEANGKKVLDGERLDGFVERILRDVGEAEEGSGLVRLAGATRSARTDTTALIAELAAGHLRPVARLPGGRGLGACLLRESDLVPRAAEDTETLNLQQFAGAIGMHPEAVSTMLREGMISARRAGASWTIPRSEVARFEERFVTGAKLAVRQELAPRALINRLAKVGVHPVIGPPACRQVVYLRGAEDAQLSGRRPAMRSSRSGR
ncbi:TniQ family protein [Aureimonas phyllosphaerae]|nr:TniQ family protein [Aureimonas phyllosphaerae]MBB3961823.1 hypothetical protein [Aureimonas phyllosphaerae]SFF50705.1 TniQ protein [Aureimonas phyllosphaerae]